MQIKMTIGRGSAGGGYWVGERRGARGERRFERERERSHGLVHAKLLPWPCSTTRSCSSTCANTSNAMKSGPFSTKSGRREASELQGSWLGSTRRLDRCTSRQTRRRKSAVRVARQRDPCIISNIAKRTCSTWDRATFSPPT